MINRPDVTARVRLCWRFALLALTLISLSSATHLSISRTYATTTSGLFAWGDNDYGQLGTGTTTNYIPSYIPVQVSGLTGVTAIAGGRGHSLALKGDGTVWAWGDNSSTPGQVNNLTGVTAIAAGGGHNLALKGDGTVWAWGYNPNGQLGTGTTTISSTIPVQVSGLTGVTAIAAGGNHSLAPKGDGSVWAWGYDQHGQLGNGTATDSSTPVQVSGLTGVTAIAAGEEHSLALGTSMARRYNLNGVACPRPSTCVVVGASGTILRSTDGGRTWRRQPNPISGTPNWLGGVACPSASTCVVVGASGTILRSTNGGRTWRRV
jgi:alpha-tubulin suppressor-like RCC1 family protein